MMRGLRLGLLATLLVSGLIPEGVGAVSADTDSGCRPSWTIVEAPPLRGLLHGVAAISSTDAWAVGDSTSDDDVLILHWDGRRWTRVSAPRPPADPVLRSISASGPNDVWVVGDAGRGPSRRRPFAEHWDGHAWTLLDDLPFIPRETNNAWDVKAITPADAWIAGSHAGHSFWSLAPLLLHWDGSAWTRTRLPRHGDGYYTLSIDASGPGDVWAPGTIGKGFGILHWDGGHWALVQDRPGPSEVEFADVAAVAPDDAWIAADRTSGNDAQTVTWHWDGRRWRNVARFHRGQRTLVTHLAVVSTDDVWSVGWITSPTFEPPASSALHWDGTAWRFVSLPQVPGAGNVLDAADALPTGEVWAVGWGFKGAGPFRPLLLHRCG